MRRMPAALAALAAFGAAFGPAAPAWAHAQLVGASPARDATLRTAPTAVTLRFSERIDPDFATVVVSTAGQRIPASGPVVDAGAVTITLAGAVGDGAWTVAYRVVSADGHTVQGTYGFTVATAREPAAGGPSGAVGSPASRAAGSSAAPAASAYTSSSLDARGIGTGSLVALGGAVLLVAAFLVRSARRHPRSKTGEADLP